MQLYICTIAYILLQLYLYNLTFIQKRCSSDSFDSSRRIHLFFIFFFFYVSPQLMERFLSFIRRSFQKPASSSCTWLPFLLPCVIYSLQVALSFLPRSQKGPLCFFLNIYEIWSKKDQITSGSGKAVDLFPKSTHSYVDSTPIDWHRNGESEE